ncbi:MAG: hypothetical protein SGPRY_008208, partial [Prymnesium sp.]
EGEPLALLEAQSCASWPMPSKHRDHSQPSILEQRRAHELAVITASEASHLANLTKLRASWFAQYRARASESPLCQLEACEACGELSDVQLRHLSHLRSRRRRETEQLRSDAAREHSRAVALEVSNLSLQVANSSLAYELQHLEIEALHVPNSGKHQTNLTVEGNCDTRDMEPSCLSVGVQTYFDAFFEDLLLTSMLFMMMLLFDCMNFFREVHDNLEGMQRSIHPIYPLKM